MRLWSNHVRLSARSVRINAQGLTNPTKCRIGNPEAVLLIAEEQAVCSGRLKRMRDSLLPLLEHAIAYLNEFRVRFDVGVQFL